MTPTTYAPPIPPRDKHQAEPLHLYALHLIAYTVANGPGLLSDEQLETAIQFYPLAVHRIEPAEAEALAAVRRRMTNSQKARQEQKVDRDRRIQEWITAAGIEAQEPEARDQADQEEAPEPIDPRDQAIRLMRAALTLIMDPGATDDGQGPGSRVPVTPRPPKFPPSSGALAIPPSSNGNHQANGNSSNAGNPPVIF